MENADDREQIEIFISCRSLKTSDIFTHPSYQIVLYTKNNTGSWTEYGRTEAIEETANPNFVKTFIVEYIFEVQQHVKFQLTTQGSSQNLGSVQTTIGAIVGAKNQTLICELKDDKGDFRGKIAFRCDKAQNSSESAFVKIRVKKVANQRFFLFNSSPFLRFLKIKEGLNSNLLVHQTEVVKHNLNPVFQPFEINLGKLCNGDHLLPVKIELWDNHSSGSHSLIGTTQFTVKEVTSGTKEFEFKDPKKGGKCLGVLIFEQLSVSFKPQFIDYIRGGTQLALVTAVDFTSSNGYPHRSDSLHCYNNVGGLNAYQKAMSSCGEILLNYDYDKMVPVYGFGGKPKFPNLTSYQTMHCFPLNGKVDDPYCFGLEGIMEAYNYALHNSELSGPTLFCPIITEVMKICQESKANDDEQYYILLILTDGEIHDMDLTKKAIVDSSHLPLSIIIIGIGNANFDNMDILDGDEGLWDASGRKAQRDLVQFVPFNQFAGDPTALAAHVLEELPLQLTEYMRLVGKMPKKIDNSDINAVLNSQRILKKESSGPKPYLGASQNQGNPGQQVQKGMNYGEILENNNNSKGTLKFAARMAQGGFLNNALNQNNNNPYGFQMNQPPANMNSGNFGIAFNNNNSGAGAGGNYFDQQGPKFGGGAGGVSNPYAFQK